MFIIIVKSNLNLFFISKKGVFIMKVNAVNKAKIIAMLKKLKPSYTDKEFDEFCYIFSLGCVLYEKEQKLKGKGSTEQE